MTADYSCICYFKQRINWYLVFAQWPQWKNLSFWAHISRKSRKQRKIVEWKYEHIIFSFSAACLRSTRGRQSLNLMFSALNFGWFQLCLCTKFLKSELCFWWWDKIVMQQRSCISKCFVSELRDVRFYVGSQKCNSLEWNLVCWHVNKWSIWRYRSFTGWQKEENLTWHGFIYCAAA